MNGAAHKRWYRIVEAKAAAQADWLRSSDTGRFHRDPILEPTSYAAGALHTAWLERVQDGEQPNLTDFKAFLLECSGPMCDLREAAQRERCQIGEQELRADPPSERCYEVARRLRHDGVRGLIYSSKRDPEGVCLAVFLENTNGELRWREAGEEWQEFVASLKAKAS